MVCLGKFADELEDFDLSRSSNSVVGSSSSKRRVAQNRSSYRDSFI